MSRGRETDHVVIGQARGRRRRKRNIGGGGGGVLLLTMTGRMSELLKCYKENICDLGELKRRKKAG